jgi:hypothetical protein
MCLYYIWCLISFLNPWGCPGGAPRASQHDFFSSVIFRLSKRKQQGQKMTASFSFCPEAKPGASIFDFIF